MSSDNSAKEISAEEKKAALDTSYHRERMHYAKKLYDDENLLSHRYVFILTNLCNLRCSFCFQEKKKLKEALKTEEWLQVVSQIPDYGWVTLTGGEPFMFVGFDEVFHAVTDRLKCNIVSNGLMIDERRIELLLSKPNFEILSISIDDIGNKVRDVKPEAWAKAEKNLRRFVERRNELNSKAIFDTKTVVLDENADQLFNIHKYCVETLGADTHSFQILKGSPIQHADYMFPMEAMYKESKAYQYKRFDVIIEQFELVRQYNLETGRRGFTHPKVADLNGDIPITSLPLEYLNNEAHESVLFEKCMAPWESNHINVDGNLFPCMAIKMGNVREESLVQIAKGERFKQFKDTIREKGTVAACNRCGYLTPVARLMSPKT